jgi:hypothetical protein
MCALAFLHLARSALFKRTSTSRYVQDRLSSVRHLTYTPRPLPLCCCLPARPPHVCPPFPSRARAPHGGQHLVTSRALSSAQGVHVVTFASLANITCSMSVVLFHKWSRLSAGCTACSLFHSLHIINYILRSSIRTSRLQCKIEDFRGLI